MNHRGISRSHQKHDGRTYRHNESSRCICSHARGMGIWCDHGVSISLLTCRFLLIRFYRPLMGGTFARPADQFPEVFTAKFWRDYPYFLSAAAPSAVVLAIFIFTGLYFKEVSSAPSRNPAGNSSIHSCPFRT